MITHEELMRYLDGELPPERVRAVEEAMERSTELRRDHAVYSRMKADLGSMGESMGEPDGAWEKVNRAITRPIGWILFVAGAAVWLAYVVYTYLTSPEAMWMKLATSAVVVGLAMLLLSALLDRVLDLKTDPYKEIHR